MYLELIWQLLDNKILQDKGFHPQNDEGKWIHSFQVELALIFLGYITHSNRPKKSTDPNHTSRDVKLKICINSSN